MISCLIISVSFVLAHQSPRRFSKYESPAVSDGLYYAVSKPIEIGKQALVLSYNDAPIPHKANDPDAPIVPGFYPSYRQRFDFKRVEIIGNKVYFKTRSISGVRYEFVGTAGAEVVQNFDASIPVPFITGTLTKFRGKRIIKKEEIKFSHAVIA